MQLGYKKHISVLPVVLGFSNDRVPHISEYSQALHGVQDVLHDLGLVDGVVRQVEDGELLAPLELGDGLGRGQLVVRHNKGVEVRQTREAVEAADEIVREVERGQHLEVGDVVDRVQAIVLQEQTSQIFQMAAN